MGCKLENTILLYSLCNDLYIKRDAVRYALHIINFYMHTNHPLYLLFDLKCILIGCKIPCYLAQFLFPWFFLTEFQFLFLTFLFLFSFLLSFTSLCFLSFLPFFLSSSLPSSLFFYLLSFLPSFFLCFLSSFLPNHRNNICNREFYGISGEQTQDPLK